MLGVHPAPVVARHCTPWELVGVPEVVDCGEVLADSANWDLSELEDNSSTVVPAGIVVQEDNVPLDEIPDRLLGQDLLAHLGYYCYYCCMRYLSQTVADDAVACLEDDRTESRNFFPVSCTARVLHPTVSVRAGTPDDEQLSSSKDGNTVGKQDV